MSDKIVLITGASSGIGRATAVEFAKNGYDVAINYCKNKSGALELKQQLEEFCSTNAFLKFWDMLTVKTQKLV